MKLTKCEKGHLYDNDKYIVCPFCENSGGNMLIDDRLRNYEPIDGKWKFDSLIGNGSFGKVYKIVNIDDPSDIAALKVISIDKDTSTGLLSGEVDFNKTRFFSADSEKCNDFEDIVHAVEQEIVYLKILNECKYVIKFYKDYRFDRIDGTGLAVYCKIELPKVADWNWRMLHLQIGESCKTFA
ncbi:hypothetical protein, partial [Anaerostipes faecalis]|uniref:hypothetical protein n=1 Tax=Anaerostipes faecalis TaxID=2738446 RepID=UPI003EFF90DE